ncbi:MAG: DNA repair protein RecN [Acidimicrobiales bacterium]
MLEELRVRELGVIEDVDIVFGTGLTAITGETGAGKTLVVEALEFLLGGRADPVVVRSGAEQATIEGRFSNGDESVLRRVVPRQGRSRAEIDNKMVPISALEETGRDLVDLHGQHTHQSLLRGPVQRAALDRFCGVDLEEVRALGRQLAALTGEIESLGGDERHRARELDLFRYERDEIERAAIASVDEDDQLLEEEETLRNAAALREAVASAYAVLEGTDEPGALVRLGEARAQIERFDALSPYSEKMRSAIADLDDLAGELRRAEDRFEEDPERLEQVRARRQLLRDLIRKHGESLADVVRAGEEISKRIAELESSDERRERALKQREEVGVALVDAERVVGDRRRKGAGVLAGKVEDRLRRLGMRNARLEVIVGDDCIGDDVEFRLGANPGEATLPLSKVASGGELARAMLALRLVLSAAPPTLVFDEVDAGIGGEAALSVGRALAELGKTHQVLVVTHLAQVAAHANHQLVVEKHEVKGRSIATVRQVRDDDRLVELSRMLSGHPNSKAAREHAAELLQRVGADR